MLAASADTLGLIAICRDMGVEMRGDVYVDSSAALGVAQRTGHGKARHLRVQALWVQEVKCNRRLKYTKVVCTRDPADILTKHVPRDTLDVHMRTLGVSHEEGRAEVVPNLDSVEPYTAEYLVERGGKRNIASNKVVQFMAIPAIGKGRPCKEAKKSKVIISGTSERATRSIDSVTPCIEGGALGGRHLVMIIHHGAPERESC